MEEKRLKKLAKKLAQMTGVEIEVIEAGIQELGPENMIEWAVKKERERKEEQYAGTNEPAPCF